MSGKVGWFFFFFFQAEDGIRDRDVTGVQTCAPPIYRRLDPAGRAGRLLRAAPSRLLDAGARAEPRAAAGRPLGRSVPDAAGGGVVHALRSEERRVGKEGRSGGGPMVGTKKGGWSMVW